MPAKELERIVDAQSAARDTVTTRTTDAVTRLTAGVDNFADPVQVARYATLAGIAVGAGQKAVATLTETYLSRVATVITGLDFRPQPVAPEMGATLRSLPTGQGWGEVYQRVATAYRVELAANGGDRDVAFYKANLRARKMVEADLGLSMRHQSDVFLRGIQKSWASKYPEGERHHRREYMFAYRRIIRPELSNGNVCGLCIAASTRVYYRGDLVPLHAGCHCEVMLVTRDTDPGEILNREGLDALYAEAGGTDYLSLRRTKYVVHEHGELGPQLRLQGHSFRGPDDVAAA